MQWQRTFTFGIYTSDKAGFTLKYCENLAKPNLKCQGMCHLKKLLSEQHEDGKGKTTLETEISVNLFQEKCLKLLLFRPHLKEGFYQGYSSRISVPFKNFVFRPPAV